MRNGSVAGKREAQTENHSCREKERKHKGIEGKTQAYSILNCLGAVWEGGTELSGVRAHTVERRKVRAGLTSYEKRGRQLKKTGCPGRYRKN